MFQLMRNSPTCAYIDQNLRKWKLCYMDPRCVCMGKKNMVEIPQCTTFLKWLWVEQCLIPKKWDHQRTHKIFLILSRLCTPCPKKRGLRIWSTSTSVLFNSTQQIGRCFVLCMVKKIQYTVANWMSIFCQIVCWLFGKKYDHITKWSF